MTMEPHDPTRSGPPVPAASAGDVVFSISEIQAACLKAARGSGLPWGLAEEAGMSAAWLAAAGLPGPELMLQLLEGPRGEPPAVASGSWRAARGGSICPVRAGAALCDFATLPEGIGAGTLAIADVRLPLLVLPFAAQIARRTGRRIAAEWPNMRAVLGPNGYRLSVTQQGAELAPMATVTLAWTGQADGLIGLKCSGRRVVLDIWRRLDERAMKTTVPATARSHADAGAAASDND